MLVLSRMKHEQIIIHNDIIITVVEIRGDKVRIGIDCPKEIPVHMKKNKCSPSEVDEFLNTARNCKDYDEFLRLCMEYFEVA